ncbi:hypothetical protein PAEPH01_0948 [Pancytospora epiphaga]|nr:hypothetical protein PAEPH01_0948 [Pancytospora epiphaga]
MSESIRLLIECERKARIRIDEALKTQKNVREQAYYDAEAYIRSYISQCENEIHTEEESSKTKIKKVERQLEENYLLYIDKLTNKSIDEAVELIVSEIIRK